MIRHCYECDYCEPLETKHGAHIHICLDEDGAFFAGSRFVQLLQRV